MCQDQIRSIRLIANLLSSIRAILKAHQLEGISFLLWLRKNNAHGILADEMGLGKTLQILSFFELVKNMETEDRRPFLVVCPLSVLSCWQNEVDTWTTLRVVQWYGDSEKRKSTSQMVKSEGIAGLYPMSIFLASLSLI